MADLFSRNRNAGRIALDQQAKRRESLRLVEIALDLRLRILADGRTVGVVPYHRDKRLVREVAAHAVST